MDALDVHELGDASTLHCASASCRVTDPIAAAGARRRADAGGEIVLETYGSRLPAGCPAIEVHEPGNVYARDDFVYWGFPPRVCGDWDASSASTKSRCRQPEINSHPRISQCYEPRTDRTRDRRAELPATSRQPKPARRALTSRPGLTRAARKLSVRCRCIQVDRRPPTDLPGRAHDRGRGRLPGHRGRNRRARLRVDRDGSDRPNFDPRNSSHSGSTSRTANQRGRVVRQTGTDVRTNWFLSDRSLAHATIAFRAKRHAGADGARYRNDGMSKRARSLLVAGPPRRTAWSRARADCGRGPAVRGGTDRGSRYAMGRAGRCARRLAWRA
jgi:hypothetical protein